jgi:hypothetical protein
MGRPLLEIDEEQVFKLAGIGCTQEEISLIVGCSVDTLDRRFADTIKKGFSEMKMSLRRTQLRLAEEGNAALAIWLGKHYLHQREPKLEIDVNTIDAAIEQQLAGLASRSETKTSGEAEGETVH